MRNEILLNRKSVSFIQSVDWMLQYAVNWKYASNKKRLNSSSEHAFQSNYILYLKSDDFQSTLAFFLNIWRDMQSETEMHLKLLTDGCVESALVWVSANANKTVRSF